MSPSRPTRTRPARTFGVALLAVVALASAACGSDGSGSAGSAASVPDDSTASADVRAIEHDLGTTEVPADPQRVVTLGYMDQDYVLALGVVPVGIRDWFGEQPNAVWPWARDLLGDAEPTKLDRELNYEAIAALEPDLIVAVSAGFTPEEYELVSEIAPTVTQPEGVEPFTISWQEHTRHVGATLGREAKAEELVAELEGRVEEVREEYPEFGGAEYAFASVAGEEHYLYGPTAPASTFLVSLGFVVPDDVAELTDNENAYFLFSEERFDVVDRPLTVWSEGVDDPGVQSLLANPLYTGLAAHQEGRDLFLGNDLYGGAFSFSSVLSLDLLVDDLVPDLALALDGDPATEPALRP